MENRLKEEFLKMEIPDMKEDIMKNAKKENAPRERRRIRPAAVIVMAALVVVLAVTVGAAAGGMLRLNRGGKILVNVNGGVVNPTGFHLEGDVNVPLSEKALENIRSYVSSSRQGEVSRYFETDDLSVMEDFLDMPLVLPENIEKEAILYELRAYGTDGNAATIYLRVQTEDNPDAMRVYLRSTPGVIMTASEPEMEEYALPDGTPATIAAAKYQEGGLVAHALYRKNDAVYHVRVFADGKRELMENVRAILDTVG